MLPEYDVRRALKPIINYYRNIKNELINAQFRIQESNSTLRIISLYDTEFSCPNNHGLSCKIDAVFNCQVTDNLTNQVTNIKVPLELKTGQFNLKDI